MEKTATCARICFLIVLLWKAITGTVMKGMLRIRSKLQYLFITDNYRKPNYFYVLVYKYQIILITYDVSGRLFPIHFGDLQSILTNTCVFTFFSVTVFVCDNTMTQFCIYSLINSNDVLFGCKWGLHN